MWDAPGAQNALQEEGHTFTGVVKMIQKTSSVHGGVVRLPLLRKHMPQSGTFPAILYMQEEHAMNMTA